MSGLMQPGPTLRAAEEARRKRGSQGLLEAVGEPLSYAPGIGGLLGNALLGAQYLTGEKSPEEGAQALAMLTGLMQGTKVAPIMRNAIKVYHGSPHKFDKASSEHIGKGEGAQAYGHGLYWAENPEVAKQYDQAGVIAAHKSRQAAEINTAKQQIEKYQAVIDGKAPRSTFAKSGDPVPDSWHKEQIADAQKFIEDSKEWFGKRNPNLYEASLRWPDPAREAADPLSAKHFLDWDRPLSEQPESVRNNLLKMIGRDPVDGIPYAWKNMKASEFVKEDAAKYFGSPEAASEYLNAAGIPGITYLDAGSRSAGTGTRNYVTFDDALVELLKRNGVSLAK